MEKMIKMAQSRNLKVILITPSPDQRIDISDPVNPLNPYAEQIRLLALQFKTGLADPYQQFRYIKEKGELKKYMSSVNHPNEAGHLIIVESIMPYF